MSDGELDLLHAATPPPTKDIDDAGNDFFGQDALRNEEIGAALGPCLAHAVLPNLAAGDLGAERIERWAMALATNALPSLLQTSAALSRIAPEQKEQAVSLVRRGLASRVEGTVYGAMVAIHHFLKLNEQSHTSFPAVLSADVAAICAVRREPGLASALRCACTLLRAGLVAEADKKRLVEGLEFLLAETDYENWDVADSRTKSLSLIRRESVRLAHALKELGEDGPTLDGWLSASASDPIPEVRFALARDTEP